MRKIRDVLRLHLKGGLSQRQIAAALGISKGVVAKYISLATQLGLGWDDIAQLSETTLERRLIPPTPPPEYFVRPDFGQLHHEMCRKGMTIASCAITYALSVSACAKNVATTTLSKTDICLKGRTI